MGRSVCMATLQHKDQHKLGMKFIFEWTVSEQNLLTDVLVWSIFSQNICVCVNKATDSVVLLNQTFVLSASSHVTAGLIPPLCPQGSCLKSHDLWFFLLLPTAANKVDCCTSSRVNMCVHVAGFCLSGPAACVHKHMKCVSRRGGWGGGAVDGKWRVSKLTLLIPINHNSPFKSTRRKLHFPHPRSAPRSAALPVSILISRLNDCNCTTMIHGNGQQFLCPFQTSKKKRSKNKTQYISSIAWK